MSLPAGESICFGSALPVLPTACIRPYGPKCTGGSAANIRMLIIPHQHKTIPTAVSASGSRLPEFLNLE